MTKLNTTFTFEKATKTTFRFREDETQNDPIIGTLYVKKSAFEKPDEPPEKLRVTVEVLDE